MILSCLFFWRQSFGDVLSYMCSYHFQFGLGCRVANILERAAHSVDHMFPSYFDYLCKF